MRRTLLLALAALGAAAALAAAQMPDVSQMSGVPLPASDLPNGTISVRVVRGDLSNNVAGHPVELHGGGRTWQAKTDDNGRAQFANLPSGTMVHAVTEVDGQRLESQEVAVPAQGGFRIILVATAGAAQSGSGAAGAAGQAQGGAPSQASPPASGEVTLGGQSRFVVEVADEALDVYALLEIANPETSPVQPREPVVFPLPDDAQGATVLEGSSPQATVEGRTVKVTGPFAPGRTPVQFAYRLPYGGSRAQVRQPLPLALGQTTVIVSRVGDVRFTSPQVQTHREMPGEGHQFLMGTGPGLPAGSVLAIDLTGLPHHSRVPRYTALALAALIVVFGVWLAVSDGAAARQADRDRLEGRREALLGELVQLEERHRAGRGDPARYEARRRDLLAQLEQIYARLDEMDPAFVPGAARIGAGTALRPAVPAPPAGGHSRELEAGRGAQGGEPGSRLAGETARVADPAVAASPSAPRGRDAGGHSTAPASRGEDPGAAKPSLTTHRA